MRRYLFVAACIMLPTSVALSEPSLQEKLAATWARYDEARSALLEHVARTDLPLEKRMISRAAWESILAGTPDEALTRRDLRMLRLRQRRQIRIAKHHASQQSLFHLEKMRTLPVRERTLTIRNFCAQLPKGGMLHIHPSGTYDRKTVHTLLTQTNPVIKFQQLRKDLKDSNGNATLFPDEQQWLDAQISDTEFGALAPQDRLRFEEFSFLPPGKQPFPRFNAAFYFLDYVSPDWPQYEQAVLDFAWRAVKANVNYVEFTSGYNPKKLELVRHVEHKTGLMIRINHAFNRTETPESLDKQLQTLLNGTKEEHLTGIDFLDDEGPNPAFERGQILYGRVLAEVLKGHSNLHRTMHAGELGDIRNPRDAMILGAERLGHGVRLNDDPVALEYAATHRIPVEINITSNLRLTDVESVSTHPFLDYLRLGIPVSLSTDDEGIVETDINRECELAISETDVTYDEMKRMAFHSLQTSFASDKDRASQVFALSAAFKRFEEQWTRADR